MDRFVLRSCKLRVDRFVVVEEEPPLELSWKELCLRLAPSHAREALLGLRSLTVGAFVGLLRRPIGGPPSNFVLVNQDRSNRVAYVLDRDTTFAERLLEVYRVEELHRDAQMSELGLSKRPQHV